MQLSPDLFRTVLTVLGSRSDLVSLFKNTFLHVTLGKSLESGLFLESLRRFSADQATSSLYIIQVKNLKSRLLGSSWAKE